MTEGIHINRPAYRILTKRLELRCFALEDAQELRDALAESRADLVKFLPWAAQEPQTLDEKLESARRFRSEFDRGTSLTYGIFQRNGPRLLGAMTLLRPSAPGHWELGYWLRSGSWGQGFATEAAAAVTSIGFRHYGLVRLEILFAPDNLRSRGIPERLGFHREGVRREPQLQPAEPGTWRDSEVWSLHAPDFEASPSAGTIVEGFDGLGRTL